MVMMIEIVDRNIVRDRLRAFLAPLVGEFEELDRLALEAAMVRQTAARLGASSRRRLAEAVEVAFDVLLDDGTSSWLAAGDVIDDLIASGDLLEGRESGRALIFMSPPMFIRRRSGSIFVIGGLPETGGPSLDGLRSRGAFREIIEPPDDDGLRALGLEELPPSAWMQAPNPVGSQIAIRTLERSLADAPPAGAVDEIVVFDPLRPLGFYRGRLVPAGNRSGRFIARRERKWIGPIWCFCEINSGRVVKFVDLPVLDSRFGSRDEAWWMMHAIDATSRQPQRVSVLVDGTVARFSFAAPIPGWTERRLLAIGSRSVQTERGALMTFTLPVSQIDEELDFLQSMLWLAPDLHRSGGGS